MSLLDAYRRKLETQIREHKANLDVLKTEARRFAAGSKIVGQAELATAEKHLEQVKAKFNELKGAGGVALGEIKAGLKTALADLSVSTKKAARHFKAHAAPARPPAPRRRPAKKTKAARRAPAKAR
jgi:hypothetical protein